MFKSTKEVVSRIIENSHLINTLLLKNNFINAQNIAASMCNKESFSDIKNINQGKSVAICGAGPSLAQYKPIKDCMHIALNRALLNRNINFDWFIADDWDGICFMQNDIVSFNGLKFFGHCASYERQVPESFRIKCNARRYYTDDYITRNGFKSRFVCDIDKMAIGVTPNIGLQAMQIALFTNPAVLYIVGCDASAGHFVEPSNITNDTFSRQIHDSRIAVSGDKVIEMWKKVKKFAEIFYPDTKIISVNPVGLKGIFEDMYM